MSDGKAGHGEQVCNGSVVLFVGKRSCPFVLIGSVAGAVGSESLCHTESFVPEMPSSWMICLFADRMTLITGLKTPYPGHVIMLTTRTESPSVVGEAKTLWNTMGGNDSGWMPLSFRHSYNILLCVESIRCSGLILSVKSLIPNKRDKIPPTVAPFHFQFSMTCACAGNLVQYIAI